jgi:hypothetical protein
MITETCFFFKNDGNRRELGSGDIANTNPMYMSHLPATGGKSLEFALAPFSAFTPST